MATPDILITVHELTQAKARYCLAVDTQDWAALTDLMTPDVELDVSHSNTGVPVITGRDNAVAMIRTALTGARTAHQVHTPLIDADGDEARVVWAMQDRVVWDDGSALTGYGHYHERWVRRRGDWKLASLTLTRLITEESGTTER
ncbi:nuclear transport factor 2 family protein [Nocardia vinacea]|uniref:nuclear transport factor 2 family protein n=1 Tax=Nocardia vinacea TaxID=96468 RepID=UPI0002D42D20|nr:nuclear transport factor 2 family protein [Nocardia vinacea]